MVKEEDTQEVGAREYDEFDRRVSILRHGDPWWENPKVEEE